MTVSSTARRAGPFTGNGVATAFPFAFKVFAASDLAVTLTDTLSGADVPLTLGLHYSIALNADQDNSPGGTITYPITGTPMPATQKLTGTGSLAASQGLDLTNVGKFLPQTLEDAFDKCVILVQQVKERLGRTLAFSPSDGGAADLPGATARAGRYLAFDAGGQPTMASGTGNDTALRTDLAAPGGSALAGLSVDPTFPATTSQAKLRQAPTLFDAGGVADYAGTPLYDGADAGRITATDNTTAFQKLVNAAIASGRNVVRVPAGHWGIKTGNLTFSNFDQLHIVGDGIGVTILDFIKEDTSHVVYVDANSANCIAKFDTGNVLEFSDLTIKATTKAGVVNGTSGPANSAAVYFGAVWAFKIANVGEVRLTRVRAEHFNYRGFSIYGSQTNTVLVKDCQGFYNASSGFWIEDAKGFTVDGGEFALNGIFGETGTGYGVTASGNVGEFAVRNASFHHNYRKGVDSHGCAKFTVENCTFENNVLFHIALPNWAVPSGVTDCCAIIRGNTIANGLQAADRAWLKSCYDALSANGYNAQAVSGSIISIGDNDSSGVATDKMKSVTIEDNLVLCHYNGIGDTGLTTSRYFIDVYARVASLLIKNNYLNFEYAQFVDGSDVYAHMAISCRAKAIKIAGNDISFKQLTAYTNATSAQPDWGTLFEFLNQATPRTLEVYDNRFDLNDAYFMTATSTGVRVPVVWSLAGSRRTIHNNTFIYANDNYKDYRSLDDYYFLGIEATVNAQNQQTGNVFVRNGVMYKVPDGPLNRTSSERTYRLATVGKLTGEDVFYIVLDKQFETTIRISTKDGSADLIVFLLYSSYVGSDNGANALFSLSSVDPNFIEDGLTKLKVVLKAKSDLVGNYWGRITVDGINQSLGIEKVVQL